MLWSLEPERGGEKGGLEICSRGWGGEGWRGRTGWGGRGIVATLERAFLQVAQALRVTDSGTFLLLLLAWSWLVARDLP